jgi:antitoxin (DNA-binding transcriptional repressor) of toxin-antitoxin stability system
MHKERLMSTVTIEEAKATLSELIHRLAPGEEVLIVENYQPVARLLPSAAAPQHQSRQLGTLRGTVQYIGPDFEAPLNDFKEYME